MQETLETILELDVPNEQGQKKRDHLEYALEQLPKNSPQYKEVENKLQAGQEIPACATHIWQWFWELHSSRTVTESGPNPITYTDIKDWAEVTGKWPLPCETSLIKALDQIYLNFVYKEQQRKMQQNKQSSKGK